MKKNGNMGIIILAAVFASFLMFGCTQSGPEQKANQTAALDTAQAKLVLGSFEKAAALDDYTLEYVEDAQGKVSEVTLRVKGSERQATIKSALDEKNFYFGYGRMIGCVRIKDGEQTCAQVAEGSRAIDAAKAADRIFFSEKQASDDYNLNKFLIGKGAINFTGAIVPSRQAGADCSAVEYTTNYKILSINDLAYIGFAADNPTVSVFSGYRTKVCIGAQDGVPLLLNLTYNYKDVPQYYSRVALKFEKNTGRAVVTPQNLANQTEFEKKYAEAQALLDSYGKCKKLENATERDSCYAAAAFESYAPSICEKVEGVIKHDQCLIALVGHANQPGLCAKTTVLKDDCLGEAARITSDSGYCAMMQNKTIAGLCLQAFGGTQQNGTGRSDDGRGLLKNECATNADCTVGGCSRTVCQAKGNELVTTCEWKEKYACYRQQFANCGCFEGKCAWASNSLLDKCLAQTKEGGY